MFGEPATQVMEEHASYGTMRSVEDTQTGLRTSTYSLNVCCERMFACVLAAGERVGQGCTWRVSCSLDVRVLLCAARVWP